MYLYGYACALVVYMYTYPSMCVHSRIKRITKQVSNHKATIYQQIDVVIPPKHTVKLKVKSWKNICT